MSYYLLLSFAVFSICTQSLWSLGILLELQQKKDLSSELGRLCDLLKSHWQNSATLTRPTFSALHAVRLICTTIIKLHRFTFRTQKQANKDTSG